MTAMGMMPFMGKSYVREQFRIAYQLTGGVERLVHEMNRDQDGYWKGIAHLVKLEPREVAVQHNASSIEDLIDARDKAMGTIEGQYTEIKDAPE